jgi:hypothetical protein
MITYNLVRQLMCEAAMKQAPKGIQHVFGNFDPSEIVAVHAMARMIRWCFLLRKVRLSGKNFDHRRPVVTNGRPFQC